MQIFTLAKQVDTIGIQALLKECNQHMDFEGETNLKSFFIKIN